MSYEEVIVIGSRSFTGQRLVGALGAGGARVRAISSAEVNFLDRAVVIKFFEGLNGSSRAVLFPQVINKSKENSYSSFKDNLEIVHNLRLGVERARIDYLLYFSSVDVYGNRPLLPITEQSAIVPDTWYGLAKFCCESMLVNQGGLGFPVAVVRVPGMYGCFPGDKSVIGAMVRSLREQGQISVSGDGSVKRDYVLVSDVVSVVTRMMEIRHAGILNLTSGNALSLQEIAKKVVALSGTASPIVYGKSDPERQFDLEFDTSRLRALLPDFTFTSLDDGIKDYFARPV